MTVLFHDTRTRVRLRVVRRWTPVLALCLSATQIAPGAASSQDPPSTYDLALDCRTALWQQTFDDATAAGLDPRAVVTSFDGEAVERVDEGDLAILTATEQYEPTTDVEPLAIRYECRIDPGSRQMQSLTYVAIDAAGSDVDRAPTQLVRDGRLVNACRSRLEDRLDDEARRRGVERPSSDVEIAPTDVAFRAAAGRVDLEGRGRARYGNEFDWQILIFTCRYDEKRQVATRATHALETPLPELSLPTASLEALDACRLAVEDQVLDDAVRRGYRRLERVTIELPELATIRTSGALVDVSGKGQFKLDVRHEQPTPLTFACVYDTAAHRVDSATSRSGAGRGPPRARSHPGVPGRCGASRRQPARRSARPASRRPCASCGSSARRSARRTATGSGARAASPCGVGAGRSSSTRPADMRTPLRVALTTVVLALVCLAAVRAQPRPNLIWVMADDLGYGEVGSYGQRVIRTPRLDQMAREGMRFTQFYAGATVCAPSRSVLMTGQHHGRTRVRGNSGASNPEAQALRPDDVTVARALQQAGYATALVGKWGLGDVGVAETGLPRRHGFDYFFGYLNQRHAHNHFPNFLWRNEERVPLPNVITPVGADGAGYADVGMQFADDLFADEALRFVAQHQDRPFFLYWSMVTPHANNERNRALKNGAQVPDFGPYAREDWPDQDKGHAAMITRLDSYVGRLLDHLRLLGLERNTLVVFTSDNGPHDEASHDLSRFTPSGPLSGIKRSLTDGGIRVPTIAWWPGTVAEGVESAHVGYFGDWFATAADLAGAMVPDGLDSISVAPTLRGDAGRQRQHEYLYWEFHEGGFRQAALLRGRWKGIRRGGADAPVQVFDLHHDIGERRDVAADQIEVATRLDDYLRSARSASPDWPARW